MASSSRLAHYQLAGHERLFAVVRELGEECVWTQSITPHDMVHWSVSTHAKHFTVLLKYMIYIYIPPRYIYIYIEYGLANLLLCSTLHSAFPFSSPLLSTGLAPSAKSCHKNFRWWQMSTQMLAIRKMVQDQL